MRRLVEGDAAVSDLGEDAVEDHDVEVEVRVEGGAEAVEKGDGAELGVGASARAAAAQCGAELSEAKLERANQLIDELEQLFRPAKGGSTDLPLYALTLVLTPAREAGGTATDPQEGG